MTDPYQIRDGILVPPVPVAHRDDEYDSRGFDGLARMQRDHFWYRGRHRFLLHAVRRHLARSIPRNSALRAIDLGGGCGGWVDYLRRHGELPLAELALADSSEVALRYSAPFLGGNAALYQIDLLDLQWSDRWDLAFLLDVLEHIPDHEAALRQVRDALAPGGLLFVTVPALMAFWTWNDQLAHHQRRYSRPDFFRLASTCGLLLRETRYFMFFLSPLLMASRLLTGPGRGMTEEQRRRRMEAMHEVPRPIVNVALAAIFGAEAPLGHLISFPWGTSLLAVLQKPPETSAARIT
jgi:SAM-dependent methyltransferase